MTSASVCIKMEGMRDFAKNFGMHGFYHIFTSKSLAGKSFWLALFLGSMSYVTYQVIEISKSFFDYSVITKIEQRIKKPLKFPAVIFCPTDGQTQALMSANRMTFENGTKVK